MTKCIRILVVLVVMAFAMHASAETVEIRGEVVDATFQIAPFTWTAQNFGGLYYDVDRNLMSDALTSTATAPDTINCGDLVYTAYRVESGYANPDIGGYFAVGWCGQKCMAINGKPYVLSPIICEMDTNDKITLVTGEGWDIGNEYCLILRELDLESDRVWLALEKNGLEVDAAVIQPQRDGDCFNNNMLINGSPGAYTVEMATTSTTSTFVYQKDIGMEDDVPIFSVYVDAIFRGTDTNAVQLKYAILIDDDPVKVINGGVGMMDVKAVTSESVRLSSDQRIQLTPNSDVNIAESLWLHVADDMDNDAVRNHRYYPYLLHECASSGSTPPHPTPTPPPPPPPVTTEIEGMLYAGQGIEIEHNIRIELVGTSGDPESADFRISSYRMPESLITIPRGDSSTEFIHLYDTSSGELIELDVIWVSGDSVHLMITTPWDWRVTDRYIARVTEVSIRGEVVEPTGEESRGIIWDASNFAALGYDFDCNAATETLAIVPGTVSRNDRTIEEGYVEYGTSTRDANFKYGAWGSYRTISFMAEDHLAGYGEGTDCEITYETISLISRGMLSRILIDEDKQHIITSGASLQLEEGYELKIVQLDFNGGKAKLELLRNGHSVDTDIVNVPDTFVYRKDLGKLDDVPIITAHIDAILADQPGVAINGIFQISEEYISVEAGDVHSKMEIGGVSGDGIGMTNVYPIHLLKGDTTKLMGNINFVVADNATLRFSPVVELTAPGNCEVRGAVARPDADMSDGFIWNASNFAALWYDFDSGTSTETLTINSLNGRVIEDDMMTYTTHPVYQQYAINDAYNDVMIDGETGYTATGWITEKYVSPGGRADMLHRLLVEFEGDDRKTMAVGEPYDLGAGFTLTPQQIDLDGNKVWLTFARDGLEIDREVIDASHGSSNQDRTFIAYLEDVDGEDEIAVFHCYVDAVFRGTDFNIVQITHVFLIDNFCTEISTGDIYGAMEVVHTDYDEIILANHVMPTILEPGSRQRVMGNIYLKTADDETAIRFYPAAEYTIGQDDPPGNPDPEV